jgi:hypothetical protein
MVDPQELMPLEPPSTEAAGCSVSPISSRRFDRATQSVGSDLRQGGPRAGADIGRADPDRVAPVRA